MTREDAGGSLKTIYNPDESSYQEPKEFTFGLPASPTFRLRKGVGSHGTLPYAASRNRMCSCAEKMACFPSRCVESLRTGIPCPFLQETFVYSSLTWNTIPAKKNATLELAGGRRVSVFGRGTSTARTKNTKCYSVEKVSLEIFLLLFRFGCCVVPPPPMTGEDTVIEQADGVTPA